MILCLNVLFYGLAGNKMSGDIPTELGNLVLLKNLDIRKCFFVMLSFFELCMYYSFKSSTHVILCAYIS